MPDEYELAHDLVPTNAADAAEDADGDGLTNLREYLAGTDPRSASSVLRIEGVHWDGNDLRLGFTAVAGHSYSVLYRDSLAEASWLKLTDVDAVSVMMVLEVRDPNAGERAARYYQLVTPAIR